MNNPSLGLGNSAGEISLEQLPISGKIPDWLRGVLIRNGPGAFQIGEDHYRHWFDGLAMLHRFSFANGKVSYANKFLECNAYSTAVENNRITYSEFATDPCHTLFGKLKTIFNPRITDSAKVSVAQIAGEYMALAETPIQVSFDIDTLKSAGVYSYERGLSGQMTTVHPHFDFKRSEAYNLVTRYNRVSHYNIYCVKKSWKPEKLASIPVNQPGYLHSFGMTQNYFIIAEFPLVVNPLALLLWLKPYIENYKWKPGRGATFWVIDRRDGHLVGQYEGEAFFAFHHINAFEQGEEIILDINAYEDASILKVYYLEKLRDPTSELPFGKFRRYRIPLKGKRVDYEIISDTCIELANFDYACHNLDPSYRYVYASSINPEQRKGFYNQIVKIDIQTRFETTWYQPGCYPGEPVFVGRPGRSMEDDGIILSVVLDATRGTSFLLILDANSFEELAKAEIPQPVLFGYHGAFFPKE